jgi:hypothetical protein
VNVRVLVEEDVRVIRRPLLRAIFAIATSVKHLSSSFRFSLLIMPCSLKGSRSKISRSHSFSFSPRSRSLSSIAERRLLTHSQLLLSFRCCSTLLSLLLFFAPASLLLFFFVCLFDGSVYCGTAGAAIFFLLVSNTRLRHKVTRSSPPLLPLSSPRPASLQLAFCSTTEVQ